MQIKTLTLAAVVFVQMAQHANAVPYDWVDWTSATNNTASGSVLGIDVTFSGAINPPAQTAGGTNFWASNPSTYTSPEVDNGPPDSDIIRTSATGTFSLEFSQPVTNPVMALLSVGNLNSGATYVFGDEDVEVLSSGPGFFGNGTLVELANNTILGNEGHGLIRLNGTFTGLDWDLPTAEFWHGFQIGIASDQPTAVPEPATLAILGLGLVGIRAMTVRKRRQALKKRL